MEEKSVIALHITVFDSMNETIMFIIALWHVEQKVINVRELQGSGEELVMTFM